MAKVLLHLIILAGFSSIMSAQVRLVIIENIPASAELITSPAADTISSEKPREHLRRLVDSLHAQFYLEASVDSMVRHGEYMLAYIHRGRQFRMAEISADSLDANVVRKLRLNRNGLYSGPVSVEQFRILQEKLLDHYENSGYPFARVSVGHTELSGDTISGYLVVTPNQYYQVDNIIFEGGAGVRDRYLYRHLGISPGMEFSQERITEAARRAEQSVAIIPVREPGIEFMNETADLYFYIDRRKASSFSGILGLMPGGGSDRVRLAGEIDLVLINTFNRLEQIALSWKSPGSGIQEARLEFRQRHIGGSTLGADLDFYMYRQDTTWMTVLAEAGIPFTMNDGSMLRIFARTVNSGTAGTPAQPGMPASGVADINGNMAGISFSRDGTDSFINPYRGWRLEISAGTGIRRVRNQDDTDTGSKRNYFSEGTWELSRFIPVTGSSTLLLSNLSGTRMNFGDDNKAGPLFVNEMFLLGGLHSIRGFDERSLAASSFMIQRIEYRWLFERESYMFIFFDGMTYRRNAYDKRESDTPFGFGTGITLNTRAGRFSVSYAAGREQNNPVSLRSSRVHMGIINRF